MFIETRATPTFVTHSSTCWFASPGAPSSSKKKNKKNPVAPATLRWLPRMITPREMHTEIPTKILIKIYFYNPPLYSFLCLPKYSCPQGLQCQGGATGGWPCAWVWFHPFEIPFLLVAPGPWPPSITGQPRENKLPGVAHKWFPAFLQVIIAPRPLSRVAS